MGKNVVVCLDGTNNKIRSAANTNVVRLFDLLDLSDPTWQVAYYDPGVGTFSSPAAFTPLARGLSRAAGLAFGAGLRQNLAEAYSFLVSNYEAEDRLFLFGFSRGAYTARALAGMLEVVGVLRQGSHNLVPYAVSEYAKQERGGRDWKVLREYARIHAKDLGGGRKDHAPIHFVGLWDTVKAAGFLWRELRWPYTRQLPHASTVRHAVAIDEWRRPYVEYLVRPPEDHVFMSSQDLAEVWFAGVHSDVGGTFATGSSLSDIPLKWMAEEAVRAGLLVRPRAFRKAQQIGDDGTGPVHPIPVRWRALGTHRRGIPAGGLVHASVARRVEVDPGYARKVPEGAVFVDPDWRVPARFPEPGGKEPRSS